MKIRIPLVYTAEVIKPGHRKPGRQTFGEWIDVEIRSLSDDEAPVALRWKGGVFARMNGVDGFVERRWFDGKLWKPVVSSNSGGVDEHVSATEMEQAAETASYGSRFVSGNDYVVRDYVKRDEFEALHEEDFRQVVSNGRAESLATINEAVASTVVVDGMAWMESEELVYSASVSGTFNRYVYVSLETVDSESRSAEGMFRLDRFDDMKSYVLERWQEEVDEDKRIDVLMPESLRYDDEYPALLAALDRLVVFDQRDLCEKDDATILGWVELRRSVNGLKIERSEENAATAISSAKSYLETLADKATDGHGLNSYVRQIVEPAIERWNARPITFKAEGPKFG